VGSIPGRCSEILTFTTASRPGLGPTQPTTRWVSGASKLRMRGRILPLPHYVFMAWCLVKYRENFTFYKAFIILFLSYIKICVLTLSALCLVHECEIRFQIKFSPFLFSNTFHTKQVSI